MDEDSPAFLSLSLIPQMHDSRLVALNEELTYIHRGSLPSPVDRFWSVGDGCVAFYAADQEWYR